MPLDLLIAGAVMGTLTLCYCCMCCDCCDSLKHPRAPAYVPRRSNGSSDDDMRRNDDKDVPVAVAVDVPEAVIVV